MRGIVINGLVGLDERDIGLVIAAGVEVTIVRGVTRGHYFNSEPMSGQDGQSSMPKIDLVFVDLPRHKQLWFG